MENSSKLSCDGCNWSHPETCKVCRAEQEENTPLMKIREGVSSMNKELEQMIDKGLASLEHRNILARIPALFMRLRKYNRQEILDLCLWARESKN